MMSIWRSKRLPRLPHPPTLPALRPPCGPKSAAFNLPARLYVRPHDVDLALEAPSASSNAASAAATVCAEIRRIQSAGPTVKIELATATGQLILAEIPHEKFAAMRLQPGLQVYVIPRDHRLFTR